MSDQPNPAAPDAPADGAPTPTEPTAVAPEAPKPPWGDDFDAEKAWQLVQNLRSDKERLQQRPALTDEQKAKLAEYDQVLESQKTAEQKAQDALVAAENRARSLVERAVRSEVKALAAEGFADPDDAAAFLDLSKYASGDDVDSASIKADLADLLARKPHLGKSPTTRTPAPNPAQGSSSAGSSEPSQLTRQDMARMTPEAIAEAMDAGRFRDVLAGRA